MITFLIPWPSKNNEDFYCGAKSTELPGITHMWIITSFFLIYSADLCCQFCTCCIYETSRDSQSISKQFSPMAQICRSCHALFCMLFFLVHLCQPHALGAADRPAVQLHSKRKITEQDEVGPHRGLYHSVWDMWCRKDPCCMVSVSMTFLGENGK